MKPWDERRFPGLKHPYPFLDHLTALPAPTEHAKASVGVYELRR